jgi:SAM-dependent methyltransferase
VSATPRVSTIVIFLNEERFLTEAIESVLAQSYEDWELLLVDDGSTDGSSEIARSLAREHPGRVHYLEHDGHENLGMSASRNLGLEHAQGEYIAWLDGDDVWLPRKLEEQVAILDRHGEAAMVYGPLLIWYGWTGDPEDARRDYVQPLGVSADTLIAPPHLLSLFLRNDEHTPGGELVRASVLREAGAFDPSFRDMYEDGVIHAKICLSHPVYAAGKCWYRYRQHPDSFCQTARASGTSEGARQTYLAWLENHLQGRGGSDREVSKLVRELRRGKGASGDEHLTWWRLVLRRARTISDRLVPGRVRRWVGLIAFGTRGTPPSGWAHFGNLRRLEPLSHKFGFDRGTPIDRIYIESFLEAASADIRGTVLEVAERDYTTRFGGERVKRSEVLHSRPGNPEATFVGDLTTGENMPVDRYDCVILTQVLPFVWDVPAAIRHVRRSLKPGGVLLATVPGISQISRYDADRWGDFWRFTSMSVRRLFEGEFGRGNVEVTVHGNALAATALLQGAASEELDASELEYRDPNYEVTITIRAVRPAESPPQESA